MQSQPKWINNHKNRFSMKKYLLSSISLGLISVSVQATELNSCFTPGEDCQSKIVNAINAADKKILVQAYSFTSEPIAVALIDAHKRKVNVLILLDKSQLTAKSSKYKQVKAAGIPVKIDYKPAIAHNKIMVIDDAVVITGSFNFTKAAQERNAENVVFVSDQKIVERYTVNWVKREKGSKE
jgi:phosphatidylserine/phosphatidylglycerophosphate/cardiolipin synthase-like enzyme